MVQYFKLIVLVLLLSVGMGSLGSAESDSTEPDTFNRLVGVDLFGDDLTSNGVKGISLAECETLCLNDNSCKAYSFVNDKQWCFPKHGVGEAQDNVKVSSGTRELPLVLVNEVHGKLNEFYGADACSLREVYEDWNGIDYISLENGVRLYFILCGRGGVGNYIWIKSTPINIPTNNEGKIFYRHYDPIYFPFPTTFEENIEDIGIIPYSHYRLDHNFRQVGDGTPAGSFNHELKTISATYCDNGHCEFATRFTWEYTATNGFILKEINMDTEAGYEGGWNIKLAPAFIDQNILQK